MPDAWGLLTQNSALSDGDAWQHLNAQEGGGDVVVSANVSGEHDSHSVSCVHVEHSAESITQSAGVSSVSSSKSINSVSNP